jgi:hypothetical protein
MSSLWGPQQCDGPPYSSSPGRETLHRSVWAPQNDLPRCYMALDTWTTKAGDKKWPLESLHALQHLFHLTIGGEED